MGKITCIFDVFYLALSRLWRVGGLKAVSKVEVSARVRLTFRGLSCWEVSVTLYFWFQFYFIFILPMIAVFSRFFSSEEVINWSCGNYGSFLTLGIAFSRLWGRLWAVSKVESSPSEVYPAGNLQWHTCCVIQRRWRT